jgi:hypothetical protein
MSYNMRLEQLANGHYNRPLNHKPWGYNPDAKQDRQDATTNASIAGSEVSKKQI